MDYYIDINVLPDPEFNETVLLNALYSKLHRVLLDVGQGHIGVSFPCIKKNLGSKLRIHGRQQLLSDLLERPWLKGLRDYTQIIEPCRVPDSVQYRTVERVQSKSVYNKRKRIVAKGWYSVEEAAQKIPDTQEKRLDEPYASVRSLSTGSNMRIYIRHGKLLNAPIEGVFSSYGLSKTATIPWF